MGWINNSYLDESTGPIYSYDAEMLAQWEQEKIEQYDFERRMSEHIDQNPTGCGDEQCGYCRTWAAYLLDPTDGGDSVRMRSMGDSGILRPSRKG